MRYISTIIIYALIALNTAISAQPSCSFTHYSHEDGLSQNTIMSIAQDHDGFMWFATWDGINRFDGFNFKVYKSSQNNNIKLSNNRCDVLGVDKYNFIWFLSYDKKAYRLNPRTDKFDYIVSNKYDDGITFSDIKYLPSGIVWLLSEDEGAVRIKTNPLDYKLTAINYAISDKNGYKSTILDVLEDSKQQEWLITNNGLIKISKNSVVPKNYFRKTKFNRSEKTQSFYSGCMAKDSLYFGSDDGRVWCYSIKSDIFKLKELSLKDKIISINYLGSDKILFVTEKRGFAIYDTKNGQYHCYDENTISNYPKDNVRSVYIDNHNEIWFEMSDWGKVSHFNPYSGVYKIEKVNVEQDGPYRSHPKFRICEDKNNNLWVHPRGGGFSWFDRSRNMLVPFHDDPLSNDWKFSNMIHTIFSDRQGNLWLGTHSEGLDKITFYGKQFDVWAFANNNIDTYLNVSRAFYVDNKKRIWIGKKNGKIDVYSSSKEYLGYVTKDGTISKNGESINGVAYDIIQDSKSNIWIATKGNGIVLLKEVQNNKFQIQCFTHDIDNVFSLSDNSVYKIYEDKYGRIWIATFGGGLNYITHDSNGKTLFINNRNRLINYPIRECQRIRNITSDSKGNMWVSTCDGLLRFKNSFKSPEGIKFQQYKNIQGEKNTLSNNNVYKLLETKSGEIYIATYGGGLDKIQSLDNKGNAIFKSYTIKDGLPSDILLSLVEDDKNNLWISTEDALCKFIPSEKKFENYNERDFGIKLHFEENASLFIDSHHLMFGTRKGMLLFDPSKIKQSNYIPPLVFTDLKICNQSIKPGNNNSALSENINSAKEIRLKPKDNVFSLSFAAIDMTSNDNIRYAYFLDGFDKKWNYVDKQRSATYTNLSPGTYTLHVKSTNRDGVWVNNERTLSVVFLPTFWETSFGIVLIIFGVIALFVVSLYIFFTIYKLKHEVSIEQQVADIKLRFFTNISHELRTPLTLVAGPLDYVLKNCTISDEVKEQLQVVSRNTDRMLRLVNQILDFRKIQKNKMKLRLENVDIVPFVRSIMNNFEQIAEEHKIDFIFESEIDSIHLWIDTDKLEKIVFNLLSNAFKYTPEGKMITLFIRENEDNVAIGVQDQGIGIPENKRSKIFVRFENILDKNLFNSQSSGIGLSLVKELVDLHKATIDVSSKVGVGSCFTVTFQKGKEQYSDDTEFIISDGNNDTVCVGTQQNKDISQIPSEENIVAKDKTMLIVEDNIELRFFLKSIFSKEYNIVEAANGMEGLSKSIKFVPDIIISDIMMPEMDGVEMTRRVREEITTSHIPIVLLTAKTDMDSKISSMRNGADDYITKPFSATYLQVRIQNILERRRIIQQKNVDKMMNINSVEAIDTEEKQPELSVADSKFMDKLTEIMEKNMDNGNLVVEDLVNELALSRSVFFKKLKTLTGMAPVEFIKEMRIKRAAQLIQSGEFNMTQISYMVGINDPRYFSKCFKSKYGMTPTEFKDKKVTIH